MAEETRIYVVVAQTVQATKNTIQPAGRQVAQVAHVVSKLRHDLPVLIRLEGVSKNEFVPMTTIVLGCRDSDELFHAYKLAARSKLNPVIFSDHNPAAYGGTGSYPTAIAFYATKKQMEKAYLTYLPLWGS